MHPKKTTKFNLYVKHIRLFMDKTTDFLRTKKMAFSMKIRKKNLVPANVMSKISNDDLLARLSLQKALPLRLTENRLYHAFIWDLQNI